MMQVQGLCLGMVIGTAVHLAAYCWIGYATDWEDEACKAAIRAEVKLELGAINTFEGPNTGNASARESWDLDHDNESTSLLQKSHGSVVSEADEVSGDKVVNVQQLQSLRTEDA